MKQPSKIKILLPLGFIVFCIFILYLPSVFFKIKAYDEIKVFQDAYLPVCYSFRQLSELISTLGLKNHLEAVNSFYSNITSIRCNPLGDFLILIIQFLFKKNSVYYHAYSLVLHILNSILAFFILKKVSNYFFKTEKEIYGLILVSLLTLLWALHPVNLESVLLLTNYNALLGYFVSFIITFLYINHLPDHKKQLKPRELIYLGLLYLPAVFIAEYTFILPLLIFYYVLGINLFESKDLKTISPIKVSVLETLPLTMVALVFILSFLLSETSININNLGSIQLILERIFWFSPQVIFHLFKLLIFPSRLSVDQSLLASFGKSYFDPYSILCIGFVLGSLVIAFISVMNSRKKFPFFFIITACFLTALLPFSHILAPLYNIASERYLYFPSFIFIFGIAHCLFYKISTLPKNNKTAQVIIIVTALITLSYSCRSFFRIQDWQNSESLYLSAIKSATSPFAQALRYKTLVPQEKIFTELPHREVYRINQISAIELLRLARLRYKEDIKKYQSSTPEILKFYGLDPLTLYAKSSYLLAHSEYILNNNINFAIKILKPLIEKGGLSDSNAIALYASLLLKNGDLKKAEETFRLGYRKNPFSPYIVFPLCQTIYMNDGSLDEIERICLKSFKLFPYDSYTLLFLIKTYKLKNNDERFAWYSYIYGLRTGKMDFLKNSYNIYSALNKAQEAERVKKSIDSLI